MASRPNPVRIDEEMYLRLQAAAEREGTSVTEQVRRRLDRSLTVAAVAAPEANLAKLQGLIADMAGLIELDSDGPWHSDAFAFEAFKAGVNELLDKFKPAGKMKKPTGTGRMLGIDEPDKLGRACARLVWRQAEQSAGGANG